MANLLGSSILRESPPKELAIHLRQLLGKFPEQDISTYLFSAAEAESLPPTVLLVWLSISRSPATVLQALKQEYSILVRSAAIKRFKKDLRGKKWSETWEAVGSTSGLLSLLSQFSVLEVKLFASRIHRGIKGPDVQEKRAKITELLHGLLPLIYPESYFKTSDERPLIYEYSRLVPGCSTGFVDELLRHEKSVLLTNDSCRFKDLVQEQHEAIRRYCLDRIFGSGENQIDLTAYLRPLCRSVPSLPSNVSGFSESMLFSLNLLKTLVARPEIRLKNFSVLTDLIEPLVRRTRNRLGVSQVGEIVDLSIKYLEAHSEVVTYRLHFTPGGFLHLCIRLWGLQYPMRVDFESRLVSLFRLVPEHRIRGFQEISTALTWVKRHSRYHLLRLIFLYYGGKKVDIGNEEDLKGLSINYWPCKIFMDMDRVLAVRFLERLRNINVEDNFVKNDRLGWGSFRENSILDLPAVKYGEHSSSSILLGFLECGQDGALERALSSIEEQKKKALKAREQDDRAHFAKSALFAGIASGSQDLYRSTLLWARRYVRDPLTAKSLFCLNSMNTEEGIQLLSGIPGDLDIHQFDNDKIRTRVIEGNKTIFDALEIASSALREPSFHQPDWQGILRLFGDVVKHRLSRSLTLQRTLNISDDQLYSILWTDTLKLALKIEKVGLEPGNKALLFNDVNGPLQFGSNNSLIDLTEEPLSSPASFRFIDDLAKARDDIWLGFRRSNFPAVAALPAPFPRGLPIQCLVPFINIAGESVAGFTPFISSRAESIVFMKPDIALSPLPDDEDTRSAIGPFIDNFKLALTVYCSQGPNSDARKERMTRAWRHALEDLSNGRMDPAEAHRTWLVQFFQLPEFSIQLPGSSSSSEIMQWPIFPFDRRIDDFAEWDPAEAFTPPPIVKPRPLSPLTVDCFIHASQIPLFSLKDKFTEPAAFASGDAPSQEDDIWMVSTMFGNRIRKPAIREGLIVSALLYLGSKLDASLLAQPFPMASDVRYPGLWLDGDFLQRDDLYSTRALEVLRHLLPTVPPSLLLKLTRNALDKLFEASDDLAPAKLAEIESVAFRLLSLLVDSDRPHLATELVLKTVIERPDASSWHRKFLSITMLRRLSATKAKVLLQSFAEAVIKRMKEQSEAPKRITDTIASSKPALKPYIKVTTVKYLAQLLDHVDFIPASFALDILSELLQAATHIDIRTAIVESLLATLAECKDDDSVALGERIISVLERMIPIASGMDERCQLTEDNWKKVEIEGRLPEVYEEGTGPLDRCWPPILRSLALSTEGKTWVSVGGLENDWMDLIMTRIIIPILKRSTENNTRWIKIFLAKYGLDFESLDLPLLPVKPIFFTEVLENHWDNVPSTLMDLYQRWILFNISPPPQIAALNKTLLNDPTLRNLQDSKHWLSLYNHGLTAYAYSRPIGPTASRLRLYSNANPPPGFRTFTEKMQDYLFEQAKLVLSLSTTSTTQFERLMMFFFHHSQVQAPSSSKYLGDLEKVLERIIAYIDSLRTLHWQRDPNRKPAVLPDTLKYRLWLLPYPAPDIQSPDKFSAFAQNLEFILEEVLNTGFPYHDAFADIKEASLRVLPCYKAKVACLLGDIEWALIEGEIGIKEILRVEIAEGLFRKAEVPDGELKDKMEEVVQESRGVIRSWGESETEQVRRIGFRLLEEASFANKIWAKSVLGEEEVL